jgi:FKBP-type peptidyl-prolyl cis-trans isomerase FkpA
MRRIVTALACLLASFPALYAKGIADDLGRVQDQADTSYALGLVIGEDLKKTGMLINYGAFSRGLKDALEGNETTLTLDEALLRVQTAYNAAMQEQVEKNREGERAFLEENRRREGVFTTGSGLQYEVIRPAPEGARAGPAAVVRVNYEGSLLDGTVFDSSYTWGEPAEFPLRGVIPGWAEGIQLMTVGSAYRLYIPSALAYGEEGAGGLIPPSSLLIFDVELLTIVDDETASPAPEFESPLLPPEPAWGEEEAVRVDAP